MKSLDEEAKELVIIWKKNNSIIDYGPYLMSIQTIIDIVRDSQRSDKWLFEHAKSIISNKRSNKFKDLLK